MIAARAYRAVLLTLLVVAVAPTVLGWNTYVVQSGSMEPRISAGDVAHGRPLAADDEIAIGRVHTFVDPSRDDGRILLHRVEARNDDGTWQTSGDANPSPDATPVPRTAFVDRATLLVPWIGLPVLWARTGHWLRLTVWLAVTVAAFVAARRRLDDDPPPVWRPLLTRIRARRASAATATVTLVLVTPHLSAGLSPGPGAADAAFTARTLNPHATWSAATTLRDPYVAAVEASNPRGFWLLDETSGTTLASRTGAADAGTLYSASTSSTDGAIPGRSLSFTTGRAVLGTTTLELLINTPTSVEFWFKAPPGSQRRYLIGFQAADTDTASAAGPTFEITAAGRFAESNQATSVLTPMRVDDGQWHHAVATVSAGIVGLARRHILYVDGQQAVNTVPFGLALISTGKWRIGSGFTTGSAPMRSAGQIDAVSTYTRVLSASEVLTHWCAARPTGNGCS